MGITVREAKADDYDELCQIIDQVDGLHREHLPDIFCRPPGPVREQAYILDLIADEEVGLFVAEVDGQLAGLVHVVVRETPPVPILVPRRVAIVDNLVVRGDLRRAGVGRALMDRAHRWARAQGASEAELTVYEFNEPAIAFYMSLGYETSSRRMTKRLE
jgi:GNAT superfamily N-acetyltransferase